MAYSYQNSRGQKYFLHSRNAGKGGNGKLFFFAKDERDNSVEALPIGYTIIESDRTGLPIIKKA